MSAAALRQTPEHKRKRLAAFAKARTAGHRGGYVRKSLETKNKEGRCYYQLLDKIDALAKKLKKVPTPTRVRR